MSLHRFLFYLLILLLPTQLGKHFWPKFSFVGGLRLDYLSPTIYLTDIIIGGILLSWLLEKLKVKSQKLKVAVKSPKVFSMPAGRFDICHLRFKIVFFLFISSFLFLNVGFASIPQLAFINLLKLAEFSLLAFYIQRTKPSFSLAVVCFLLSAFWSSTIAFFQFFKQASLGGVFWFLGERSFNINTPGIATAVINGQALLRPYSTFSHPNALAGYLTVLLPFLLLHPGFYAGRTLLKERQKGIKRKSNLCNPIWLYLFTIFIILTIFITFSRAAWTATLLILFSSAAYRTIINSPQKSYRSKRITYFGGDRLSSKLFFYSLLLLVLSLLLYSPFLSRLQSLTTGNSQSLRFRQELNQAAVFMIKKHPIIGVGLNNFLIELPKYQIIKTYQDLQPAHNIYLLIAAETGLVGLGIFLLLIFRAYQKLIKLEIKSQKLKVAVKNNWTLFLSLSSLLFLALFDHYFFTLQQTQLLFATVLGFIFSGKKS